jgi:hypothetical protein
VTTVRAPVALVALLLAIGGGSGDARQDRPLTFDQIRTMMREVESRIKAAGERGNVLTQLDELHTLEAEYAAKGPAATQAIASWMLTLAPIAGRYDEALRYADRVDAGPAEGPTDVAALAGFHPRDAVAVVAHAAARARVVMVNEAHHVPQHRAFTLALLKALRREGYTYLAAETLYESDAALNARGYPTRASGYYTAEPVYGDLVRTALALGYRVVAYEAGGAADADARERLQAEHLRDRILAADRRARILVHAGYSHIDEAGAKPGAVTMAQRFRTMTGIDPLTIDQTLLGERSAPEFEHPLYRALVERDRPQYPVAYVGARGAPWSALPGTHDITIVQPRTAYLHGRPTWLRLGGTRRAFPLPADICGPARRCLVSARIATEPSDAIPIDRVGVEGAAEPPALMLPRGRFVIVVEDAAGRRVREFDARVS